MNIIVFGASGKTGKIVIENALRQEYNVTAFVRDSSKLSISDTKLTIIEGDATDQDAVAKAIKGQNIVISCLGANNGLGKTTALHEMTTNIVAAMKAHHVPQIIYVASAGIDKEIPGLSGKLMMKMLGNVLNDHRNAVQVIKENIPYYTIVRPLGLNDQPFTGSYRETATGIPEKGRRISRADVADFIIRAITDPSYKNQSISIAD